MPCRGAVGGRTADRPRRPRALARRVAARPRPRTRSAGARRGTTCPVDAWLDASGNQLHFAQLAADARPAFVRPAGKDDPPPAVRFDGKDDCLTLVAPARAAQEPDARPRRRPAVAPAATSARCSPRRPAGKNDYTSGLNVDLGPCGSPRFDTLNVEGAGMSGVANLLAGHPSVTGFEFGHVPRHRADGRPKAPAASRCASTASPPASATAQPGRRCSSTTSSLGARLYSNGPPPPYVQGFFDGADRRGAAVRPRARRGSELARVEKYLDEKYAAVRSRRRRRRRPPPGARPLVAGEGPAGGADVRPRLRRDAGCRST